MKKPRRKQRGRNSPRLNTSLPNGLAAGGPVAPAIEEAPVLPAEPIEIELPPEEDLSVQPIEDGATEQLQPDGSIVIDFNPMPERLGTQDFYENIAELLDEGTLGAISNDLYEGIEADDASRQQWLQDRERGLDMLGFKLEKPKGNVGDDGKISSVRHPLLGEAVLRFQANARGELLPSAGPVKVRDDGLDTMQTSNQSRKLEDLLNHFLTSTATEYYPDTDRMLLWVGFSGLAFKKVYTCPLRRRPVSESVDAKDLIVSDTITDLKNAKRVTHRITMRRSTMKRMQLLGVYRNIDLDEPIPEPNGVEQKIHDQQGTQATPQRPQDTDHELWECYCELDIEGFEHTEINEATGEEEPTGLPLPYRVTIDKTSRQVLEIRRNWKEEDTTDYKAKVPFVPFPFVPGFGFYGLGLLHILGNPTAAVTAGWQIMLDAGMLANFPSGFIAEQPNRTSPDARTRRHNFRPSVGEFIEIDTGNNPIDQVVRPNPFKGPDAATFNLINHIAEYAARLGGTAQIQVGEGRQDAPVGTTLALIEQATKPMSAVHKRLCAAQAEEFKLLLDEIKADPECLWRHEPKLQKYWDVNTFLAALDNCTLTPVADPNTPSHMHRLMKAQALKMLSTGNPLYNPVAVDRYVLQEIGVGDPDQFFMPPQPQQQPPVDPVKMAEVQLKAQSEQNKVAIESAKLADKERDRTLKRNLAVLDLAGELAQYPKSEPIVDRKISQMAPSLSRRQSKHNGGAVTARAPPFIHRPLPGLGGPMMG